MNDPSKNALADDGPPVDPGPSPQELASMDALMWWNGLAPMTPGQIFEMLKMMGQQGGAPAAPQPMSPMPMDQPF